MSMLAERAGAASWARGLARAGPPFTIALMCLVVLAQYEVPLHSSVRYAAYLLLVILLPGRAVWMWVTLAGPAAQRQANGRSQLENWVCGAGVGYILEIAAYVPARTAGHPRLFLLLPTLILAIWLFTSFRKTAHGIAPLTTPGPRLPIGAYWVTAGVIVYLVCWIALTLFSIHPLRSTWLVDPDEMFHLSLIGELRHHFPAVYPFMDYPGRLTYQWFVHAHMAASTWATGLPAETIYRRFDPLVFTMVAALGVGVLTMRLSRNGWGVPLAPTILVLLGSFDVTGASTGVATPEERFLQGLILLHSPTQTFAYVLAVPVAWLSIEILRRRAQLRPVLWIALIVGMIALSGAKVTFLPIFACGFLSAALVNLLQKRRSGLRTALLAFGAACLVILASSIVLYGGHAQTLAWKPLQSARYFMHALGLEGGGPLGQILVAASLLAMWLVPAAGALGFLTAPRLRWDPRVWWLLGVSISGYGANMLLGHAGNSQVYFGRAAAMFVAVLSAWGVLCCTPGATVVRFGEACCLHSRPG